MKPIVSRLRAVRTPVAPALMLLALLAAGARADVTVIDKGASNHEIVVDAETGPVAAFAARELQQFVEQSTGVKLPIVAEPSDGKSHICVGVSPASTAAGVSLENLEPEGFRLKTIGGDIHIVGTDTPGDPRKINRNAPVQCGTLSGVYEFLERYLGVLFAWHDDLGTVVPRRESLVVPDVDVTDAPDWSYRTLPYSPEGQSYALFGRRLRLGMTLSVRHSHNWFSMVPAEKYGQEHPEYFALVGGERRARYSSAHHHGGQLCTSNPEVIDICAQTAIAYFDEHPEQDMYSLSPNDGGGFCECENCRALDGGDFLEDRPDMPVLTDRLLVFYNAIAEKVAARHPDKLLGAYIYSYYKAPPKREKPHPNLYLVNATNSAHTHGRGWEREHEWEKQWTALTDHFAKYDIYYYGKPAINLIAPVVSHTTEKLPAEQKVGICGGYLYMGQSYEQLGAGHYLMAKLMWDANADARALEQRYYTGLYGAAAADVKAYYDLLERRLAQMHLEGVDVDEPAVRKFTEAAGPGISPGHVIAAYWPILDQAEAFIAQAQGRDLSDPERARLTRLAAQHRFLVGTVRGMIAAGRLQVQAAFNPEDVEMLKGAVETREAAKLEIAAYAPTLTEYINQMDKEQTAPVTPNGAFFQISQGQKPLELVAVRAAQAPSIDGLGDDTVWAGATPYYFLLAKGGVPTSLGARARLAFDDTMLYVLVDGREDTTSTLDAAPTARDATSLFSTDSVELFVSPPGGQAYYHIGLGAGGGVYDAAHPTGLATETDVDWGAGAQTAVHIAETGWSAELAVPLSVFGATPDVGQWRINVCRTRRGNADPDEYTAVAPTFGGYHVPQRFAPVRFVEQAAGSPWSVDATFDTLTPDTLVASLNAQVGAGGALELSPQRAYSGSQAVHVHVGPEEHVSIALDAPAAEGKSYRILIAHRNSGISINPAVRPQAPITRVMFRDKAGKAVTDKTGYSWDGAAALDQPDEWRIMPHVITTPPGTERIALTIFLHHPGDYWIDEVRLEEL